MSSKIAHLNFNFLHFMMSHITRYSHIIWFLFINFNWDQNLSMTEEIRLKIGIQFSFIFHRSHNSQRFQSDKYHFGWPNSYQETNQVVDHISNSWFLMKVETYCLYSNYRFNDCINFFPPQNVDRKWRNHQFLLLPFLYCKLLLFS